MKNIKKITAKANEKNRTFTIRTYINGKFCAKYRTIKMDKEEFQSSLYHTQNDWAQFLKGSDYYAV